MGPQQATRPSCFLVPSFSSKSCWVIYFPRVNSVLIATLIFSILTGLHYWQKRGAFHHHHHTSSLGPVALISPFSNLFVVLGMDRLGYVHSVEIVHLLIHPIALINNTRSFHCINKLMFEVICERVSSFVRSVTSYLRCLLLTDCSSILFIKTLISFKPFRILISFHHFHW